jgi:orotidine-5'-phosphate decarboxylase
MNRQELFSIIQSKKSFLCIGLDTDVEKIPPHLKVTHDPVFEFNKGIVDATIDLAVAYKPNLAFYEVHGKKGWESLEKTVDYIRSKTDDIFLIADAKRGDIGNTSAMYAKAFFESMQFDAITLAPYMGLDTVSPFLNFKGKWSVILALTSNKSAADFQYLTDKESDRKLFEEVLHTSKAWATTDQVMYVVGATKAEALEQIRHIIPDHFLLVPGVGAQGGSLEEVAKYGLNDHCGLLVNSSRGIIYASQEKDFGEKARGEALKMQEAMENILLDAALI